MKKAISVKKKTIKKSVKKETVKHSKAASIKSKSVPKNTLESVVRVQTISQSKPAVSSPSLMPPKPVNKSVSTIAVPVVKKHSLYVEVTPDKYFVLCDGKKIKSGKELADILQMISDDMFRYHVTDTKNDFSNWINDVFGEQDLAKKIKLVRNRLDMSIELYRHMFDKLDKLSK